MIVRVPCPISSCEFVPTRPAIRLATCSAVSLCGGLYAAVRWPDVGAGPRATNPLGDHGPVHSFERTAPTETAGECPCVGSQTLTPAANDGKRWIGTVLSPDILRLVTPAGLTCGQCEPRQTPTGTGRGNVTAASGVRPIDKGGDGREADVEGTKA